MCRRRQLRRRKTGWGPAGDGRLVLKKVNLIRHVPRASLLGKGEACRASGESVTVQGLPILETGRSRCGGSGNDRKGAWDKWRERPGSRREGLAAGRAFIVAMKPGNAGGAKGRRKVKTPETVPDQTSSIAARLERGSATMRGLERQRASRGLLGTGCLRKQGHVGPIFLYGLGSDMRSTSPLGGISPTGEPDAGDPPVRFGGRGGATQCAVPTSIVYSAAWRRCRNCGSELARDSDSSQVPRPMSPQAMRSLGQAMRSRRATHGICSDDDSEFLPRPRTG